MRVCTNCFRCYDDEVERCVEGDHFEFEFAHQGNCESISGYRLERQIEQGSNWSLFRARQIEFGHSCMIRIISANESTRVSFLNDAKVVVTFFNPAISDIYEAGATEDGELFIVSEDSHEQSLRDLLNDVGVPQLLTSVQIIRQTAEAVHALHLAGLVHRAIRPENILLTSDAEHRLVVKIQNPDLGGVMERSIVANKFTIDSSIDNIRYFAPELFANVSPSPQTDIYSLGIVFYELLTGSPPFDATTASSLIEQHRHQKPADVNINSFDLRMLITHTLMASLHKQPEKRQSSANAFARQLRHVEQLAMHSPTPPPAINEEPAQPPPVVSHSATPIRKIQFPSSIDIDHIPLVQNARQKETAPSPENAPAVAIVENALPTLPHPLPAADHVSGNHEKRSENQPAVDQTFTRQRVGNPLPVNKPSAVSLPPPSKLRSRRRRVHHQNATAVNAEKSPDIRGIVEVPRAAVPAVSTLPQKIEWDQLDDDIPSVEDVKAATFKERLPSTSGPVTIAPQHKIEPRKIELQLLDDDIPSLDDVRAVLANEPPTISTVSTAFAETTSQSMPAKVEWTQPEDDIPSIEDVQKIEVESNEPAMESAYAGLRIAAPLPFVEKRPFRRQTNNALALEVDDCEEITLVSPRRNLIRVDIDSARNSTRTVSVVLDREEQRNNIEFVPTIIGGSRIARASAIELPALAGPGYARPSFLNEPFIYRSTMVAGGVAILVLITLIASFVVTDSVSSSQVGQTEAGETVAKEKPIVQFPQPRAEVPVAPKNVEMAAVKTEAIVEQPVKPDSKKESEKAEKSATTKFVEKDQPKAAENTVKAKPQPSTIAKTPTNSNNAKAKATVEPQRRAATKNSGFATRPRIVVSP